MSFSLLIVFVFLAGLIQTLWLPLNWILMMVTIVALMAEGAKLLWFSFLAGLIFDLFLGLPWGISSLGFLLISQAVFLARHQLIFSSRLGIFLIGFFSDFFFNLLFLRTINCWKSLVFASIFLVIYCSFLTKRIDQNKDIKLKVSQ